MDIPKTTMLALSALGAAGLGAISSRAQDRPNVLILITDQQQSGKLSYLGDTGLSTPAMDRIAEAGITFTNAYSCFPLSIPQRFSMFTGMYPSQCNLRFNPKNKEQKERIDVDGIGRFREGMMATLFNNAGYETYYGGKAHLISPLSNDDPSFYGFTHIYSTERRNALGPDAARCLESLAGSEKPFLMVASYINPHDICEYDDYVVYDSLDEKFRKKKAEGLARVSKYVAQAGQWPDEDFYGEICPRLPDNHERMEGEPDGLPGKVADYTEEQWRMHRWVYDRLIEEVDSDIAPVMEVLYRTGLSENTIVVFLSDHGDMDASHRREHKTVPFQEAQKVPFIISGPGIRKGVIDEKTVVNTGLDLIPTLCGLAGIDIPEGLLPGCSVAPVAKGEKTRLGRRYIFTESENWFQVIDGGRYKYTLLDNGSEILTDVKKDPGETRNLVFSGRYRMQCRRLAKVLAAELNGRNMETKQ
ncbi:MAG: sulfatase [Candidatus Cryptobacteroides sp.]